MKTTQHSFLLAIVMGIGLLLAGPMAVIAQEHEHGPKTAKEQGDTSDKQAMRHQMMQQMRGCMQRMHDGKSGQHGMMQHKGDMTREQMREQMMAQMEACMDRMEHGGTMGGGMKSDGDGPKHDRGEDDELGSAETDQPHEDQPHDGHDHGH